MARAVNFWKRFQELLPGGVRVIGVVQSINTSAGTSTVRLRNGSTIIAKGTSVAQGSNAIVVDGQLVSAAPNLPQYDVTV